MSVHSLPHPTTAFSPFGSLPHGRGVRVAMSTRHGGVSAPPFDSLNMGDHVSDQAEAVATNRARWATAVAMNPVWMQQVHGVDVVRIAADDLTRSAPLCADAAWTDAQGVACAIMVADCLPVVLAHAERPLVAAAHAGWRGLLGQDGRGILEASLEALAQASGESARACAANLRVWLGPCIGPSAFEVGPEVQSAFVQAHAADAPCFQPASRPEHFMADVAGLARRRLARAGVPVVLGNDSSRAWCTHTQAQHYFSHRRDASVLGSTGRMVLAVSLD